MNKKEVVNFTYGSKIAETHQKNKEISDMMSK